jgi:predicted transcriptional regulator of viral defense system
MAIDCKAKKPVVDGLSLRFVRFSGDALTQGVVNIRIHGVPVRVYSVAKTLADCLKYRRKIGVKLSTHALSESIAQRKCSKERLLHFTKICRVAFDTTSVLRFKSIVDEEIRDEMSDNDASINPRQQSLHSEVRCSQLLDPGSTSGW